MPLLTVQNFFCLNGGVINLLDHLLLFNLKSLDSLFKNLYLLLNFLPLMYTVIHISTDSHFIISCLSYFFKSLHNRLTRKYLGTHGNTALSLVAYLRGSQQACSLLVAAVWRMIHSLSCAGSIPMFGLSSLLGSRRPNAVSTC